MLDLREKTAFVTGASRGIGRQLAIALASQGCHLVLHSRSTQHTESLAEQLESSGVTIRQLQADLSDTMEVEQLLEQLQALPAIDILYNNAAIMPAWQEPVWQLKTDMLKQSFQVNVISQILLCNSLVPGMLQRGFGRVINLVSDIDQLPNLAPYAITKAALGKYTHDIAPALKNTGVSMNALNPGWLKTDMGSQEAPHEVESVIPGALVPALIENDISGYRFEAQDFSGMSLEQAVLKAEQEISKLSQA